MTRTFLSLLLLSQLIYAADSSQPLAIKQDGTPLRAGCNDAAEPLAKLKKGDPVKIRFALAGSGSEASGACYAVSVEADGKKMQGYVIADELAGLGEFEQSRRAASSAASAALPRIDHSEVQAVAERATQSGKSGKTSFALAAQLNLAADALQSGKPAEAEKILAKAPAPPGDRDTCALRAMALIEMNQPDRAMDALVPALKENKNDPQLLALAGRAAYNLDDVNRAIGYWKESLELKPNAALEQMLKKVQQEAGADKSAERSYGMRFLLRYDNAIASPELARSMVTVLDQEFSRISSQLGCPADERIVTIVQSREAYFKTSGAAEWSAGAYDGKIRIPMAPSSQIDADTRKTFAHEIVHACMANLGRWPAWLHEGMAQKLSGDSLQPRQLSVLKDLARAGKLPKLEQLAGGWNGLGAREAAVAYTIGLEAVELMFQRWGAIGARNLMNNPQTLGHMTEDLDRLLDENLKS